MSLRKAWALRAEVRAPATDLNPEPFLRHAIEASIIDAERGAPYSNFALDDPAVEKAIKADRRLREIHHYAESYFLSRAHGDPDHAGLPWPEADRRLQEYLDRLGT